MLPREYFRMASENSPTKDILEKYTVYRVLLNVPLYVDRKVRRIPLQDAIAAARTI